MIQNSAVFPQHDDWKLALSQSFRKIEDLLSYCGIDSAPDDFPQLKHFPLRVTRFYADLIEKGNPDDPLLKQILPLQSELTLTPGYSADAVGDAAAIVAPGVIHKYQSRVLLPVTGACAIHCRYCFRRHFAYSDNQPDLTIDGTALDYIRQNSSVREVILSGGDPLMLSDDKLERFIQYLNSIEHVRLLRIHSRLTSVLPQRFSERLLELLAGFAGSVVLVSHINHPNELPEAVHSLLRELQSRGLRLLNQSVLLKDVNDDADTLVSLSEKLFDAGVQPYYLHRLDKVQGTAHFDVSQQRACQIQQELQRRLPGYLVPKLVAEIAGESSKTPVQCL